MPAAYDQAFYEEQMNRSRQSAEIVAPFIVEAIRPTSMVDIGCGVGFWPLTFASEGVGIAHGVDGPWVREGDLQLEQGSFFDFDFERAEPPFRPNLPRPRYDLVTSFEFIEHVDETFADPLVDLFCRLADVVVLGAAIPAQGGLHHVNERWPDYWAEKFAQRGYEACDFIRPQVWSTDVEPWYAQNPIAYFKGGAPANVRALAEKAWGSFASRAVPLVHPGQWELKCRNTVPRRAALLPRLTPARIVRRLAREIRSRFTA